MCAEAAIEKMEKLREKSPATMGCRGKIILCDNYYKSKSVVTIPNDSSFAFNIFI